MEIITQQKRKLMRNIERDYARFQLQSEKRIEKSQLNASNDERKEGSQKHLNPLIFSATRARGSQTRRITISAGSRLPLLQPSSHQ